MFEFLITVRDDVRETECTTTFTDNSVEAAMDQSLSYFAGELNKSPSDLAIVSIYNMAFA